MQFTFYEFFAGGGMARAGLGENWQCLFANDIDPKKGAAYVANWGDKEFKLGDIDHLKAADLPGHADLAWASFPCQDLSLAGSGAGLNGERSGTFWGFYSKIYQLRFQRRTPKLLVLENVCGTLTSHGGKDFVEIGVALSLLGYDFGAMVIDAALFLPQSRPRLFIVATRRDVLVPQFLKSDRPSRLWHPKALQAAYQRLPPHIRKRWIWWDMATPAPHDMKLADVIEEQPNDVPWHTPAETAKLLGQMSAGNLAKVEAAKRTGVRSVGTVYKRTRHDESGKKIQRAEVRFDDIAGCLRTPAGGSSRQIILVVEGRAIRSRLLSSREAARLMGLADLYRLPNNYNEAYHLAGDGVAVPVVRYIGGQLIEKLSNSQLTLVAAE